MPNSVLKFSATVTRAQNTREATKNHAAAFTEE